MPPKRPYFFFRSLSLKDPHFYQLSPNDRPFLTNSLSQKNPDISLSLKDPSFSHLKVKQETIFGKKIGSFENFDNVDKMLRNVWPWPWKPLFFWCISLKDPLFLCAFSLKDPFFDTICHRKTPTSEVLGGTRMSLSYVSPPPPDYTEKSTISSLY